MRRLFLGVLTLTYVMAIGGAANGQIGQVGQITLVPGPQKLVSQSPKYIAVADFNNDKFDDAVVSNSVSSKVTILLGQDGTSFGSVSDLSVGRVLRGVQAGDLNSDGIPDIVVADLYNRIFVATGNGNGTFNQPVSYQVGLYPIDVGIGNFDHQKGNDLMAVNVGNNNVTVLLNQGGNKGFTNNGLFSVGKNPKRGKVADLNGDGFDDIIVVNTGTLAADDVSVLMNTGSGSFQSTPPRDFVVGAGAKDVAIADFNNDGAPDLAVVNGGATAVKNTFSVSILLNTVAGGLGTGLFSDETPVRISCPTTLSGISVTCTPNFIAAGDFDNDGFIDLAVSFSTFGHNAAGGSVTTPGLITAYKGHGNGTFEFSSSVSVGRDPQGIAAGDFNGDGVTDLVVAERGSKSVRILTARKPPPLQNGAPCNVGGQCASTFCVDDTCCSTASCPASSGDQPAQRCDIPNTGGICALPAPLGNPCELPDQCNSVFCVDGFCCSTRVCTSGEFCNRGICGPPAPNGIPCNALDGNGGIDQCNSGHCTDNVCCADDKCPVGQSCNILGSEGVCMATLPLGQPCTVDAQCTVPTPGAASGFCTDLFCCGVRVCPTGQSCGISPHEGLCWPLPPSTPTLTPTPTATPIPTPAPLGSHCTSLSQCVSGFCTDTVCCSAATCPQGQSCDIFNSPGICNPRGGIGDICRGNRDCASGNCDVGALLCGQPFTPTQTPPPTQTPTPAPTKPEIGVICPTPGDGSTCETGFCTDGVCCDADSCASPERCDIFGSKGVCSPPLDAGQQCTLHTDCNPDFGLLCLFCSTGPPDCATPGLYCTIPPPTRTPVPTPTEVIVENTPVIIQNPPVVLTRSGGCSIDNGTDGRNVWWLAALPLIFWMRRSRLHHARISRRRDWR